MLSIGIPIWMVLTALAVGVALAMLLYFRNRNQHYGNGLTAVLFALRTLIGALLVLLLFNPYIRQKVTVAEQPTVLLAHDNSASVVLSKDSVFYQTAYLSQFENFRKELKREFQVDEYLFGLSVREFDQLDFSDQLTDLSSLLQSVLRRYYKRNVGAVVLFSDGIYNRGFDPSLVSERFPFPIYAVALGDTMSYSDLVVKDVQYNKRVSLGSTFPVRVTVGATDCEGKQVLLTLKENGRQLAQQPIEISANRFSKETDFMLEAKEKGVRQLDIEISGLPQELQTRNNLKRIFVEVEDQKYKILCIADSPHPDLGAIKSVLNDDCEMDFVFGHDEIPDLSKYQLLLLHQTPSSHTDLAALKNQLDQNQRIPVLWVIGNATEMGEFDKLQKAIELHRGVTNSMLDVKGIANRSFGTFTVSDPLRDHIGKFPPLALPHLEMNMLLPHDDLLMQEVLGIRSGLPLLTFVKGDRKMAFLMGTNVWRWRLYDYYQNQNSAVFDELFSKTLNYLLLSRDDGSAVFCKEEYFSNEPVVMTAELRNPSNELVTEPELSIRLVNKKTGETYDYVFSKRDHDYELNAGVLPEGLYTYRAEAEIGGKKVVMSGSFSVVFLGIEAQELTADIEGLRSLAASTNGRCYTIDQLPRLLEDLKEDARITIVDHHENRFEDLVHSKWVFIVLVALAAVEWVLRKMFGSY